MSGRVADRWCEAALERARCIVNDIAEDIDNGESRAELRQALAIYADLLCDECQRNVAEESKHVLALAEKLDKLYSLQAP